MASRQNEARIRHPWIAVDAPVAITHCENYEETQVEQALHKVCEAAEMPSPQGKTVLVKPNILSDAKVEAAITTHPAVVQALIHILKEQGAARILVGDSPGLQGPAFVPKACGIQQICDEEQVQWCDFTKEPVPQIIPGTARRKLPLAKALQEADMVISVAKFKTHQLMYATGTVKNLFGLVPGLHKSPCHLSYPSRESFARLISGIYEAAKPSFCILDAIIGMEGAGPANGIPRHVGLLLAGKDCSAVDVAESTIMGYDPMTIPLTAELRERRLTGWKTPQDIRYPLLDAKDLVIEGFQTIEQQPKSRLFTSLILPFFTRFLKKRHQQKQPKPLFDMSVCIRCGRCISICPGKALSFTPDETSRTKKRVEADYRHCIRCYCCHEVCPADAIVIDGDADPSETEKNHTTEK